MGQGILKFNFREMPVQAVYYAGQPWFSAVDVCRILGFANHRDALDDLGEDEKFLATAELEIFGELSDTFLVNEFGLYALIFKSSESKAKSFMKWVANVLFPEIRGKECCSSLSGIEKVQQVVEMAIVDLYEGRMSVDKAGALSELVGQYYRSGRIAKSNGVSPDLHELDAEQKHFSALVAAMWKHGERIWKGREIRQLAMKEELFNYWLNDKTIDKPEVFSRFGLLCARQCNKVFSGLIFRRLGQGRHRIFTVSKV